MNAFGEDFMSQQMHLTLLFLYHIFYGDVHDEVISKSRIIRSFNS